MQEPAENPRPAGTTLANWGLKTVGPFHDLALYRPLALHNVRWPAVPPEHAFRAVKPAPAPAREHMALRHALARLRPPPLLKRPLAGTTKEWRLWEQRTKAEHPVRYWLQETLWKDGLRRLVQRCIGKAQDLWWAVQYRLNPRHRYHVLPTGLRPGLHQLREQQLHAMFHSFARFYERQVHPDCQADWQGDEPHAKTFEEMAALYRWWTQERPAQVRAREQLLREQTFQDPVLQDDFLAVFDEDYQDHPEVLAWRAASKRRQEMERFDQEEDQRMLHRLVNIRAFLWD